MEHTPVAVIGSGPSGYSAAIYAARAVLKPIVFAGVKSGGQLMYTTEVENYAGFPEGITGPKLMMGMRQQAERFEADIQDKFVTAVDFSQRPFKLWTELPDDVQPDIFEFGKPAELEKLVQRVKTELEPSYTADSVIISTGAVSRWLGIPGEREYLSKGVSTCAVCDAAFFREKVVAVAGGGDSAMEDAMALTKFATKVYVIHRRDTFRASKIMQQRVLEHDKVEVLWNTTVDEVLGDEMVSGLKITTDGKQRELDVQGFFLAIGHIPMTKIFKDQVALDNHGYVLTRQSYSEKGVEMAQQALTDAGLVAFPTSTSVEGVFAAGDVVDVRYKQAITAAGQGCQAALDAERWLEVQE